LLDRLQREGMADERLQPLTRMVSRIHVIEIIPYLEEVGMMNPVARRIYRHGT
jgi:hypothetical protein